jgi:hypothetical protein
LPAPAISPETQIESELETEVNIRLRLTMITAAQFQQIHDHHWGIEQFHRAVK